MGKNPVTITVYYAGDQSIYKSKWIDISNRNLARQACCYRWCSYHAEERGIGSII